MAEYDWLDTKSTEADSFICGYCGRDTAPSKMYLTRNNTARILICAKCSQPSFFDYTKALQIPRVWLGNQIQGISNSGLETLYKEARDCTSVGAYTASVMACRKILMNLAVDQEAKEGENFAYYVDYLAEKGYIPPKGKKWVDAIRKHGNEANHEIAVKSEKDAKLILDFTGSLLHFNYELPNILEADYEQNNTKNIQ